MDTIKDVPVVFLSAKGQDEEISNGIDAGAVGLYFKALRTPRLDSTSSRAFARNQRGIM